MSNNSASRIFKDAIKALIKSIFKLLFIVLAWSMRLIGLICTKLGETIEKLVVKKSSL